MATIYAEDFAAGDSLFGSVYRYNRTGVSSEAQDPLYPFMWVAEGVYVNGDGRLDKNPTYTGEFETYQQAGIWVKGMGPTTTSEGDGYWNADRGCMQTVYYPTEDSLADVNNFDAPMMQLATRFGFPMLGVSIDILNLSLDVQHQNDGSHDNIAEVLGAPMPVAGQPYTVRMQWQCGTMDPLTWAVAADGNVKVWVNDELVYEASNISLYLEYPFSFDPETPDVFTELPNMIDSAQFGYFGLLGPLDNFSISDSFCESVSPIVFKSGRTSSPLVWMKLLLKGAP